MKRISNTYLIVLCLLASVVACQRKRNREVTGNTPQSKEIPDPDRQEELLGSGANRTYFWDKESSIKETTLKDRKVVKIDGLAFLFIREAALPVSLQTSLMEMEVLELPLALRVDAFDASAGQSLEVLSGKLKVQKAYSSPFPDIDTLRANDLYMINRDIDLSEKEKLDDDELLRWWHKYGGN